MPIMVRPQGKAKKIAFALIGKPANFQEKKSKQKSRINKRLVFEETSRVR